MQSSFSLSFIVPSLYCLPSIHSQELFSNTETLATSEKAKKIELELDEASWPMNGFIFYFGANLCAYLPNTYIT
jgi:hypothetical protein